MDGSTSLTEVANKFYLYNSSGTGPTLKYAGSDFVAGQFGGWTPIGAAQTALHPSATNDQFSVSVCRRALRNNG